MPGQGARQAKDFTENRGGKTINNKAAECGFQVGTAACKTAQGKAARRQVKGREPREAAPRERFVGVGRRPEFSTVGS